ncbi:MAG: hypothetical protein AB7V32_00995 [Candidatus Berkiella sp.]
MQQGPTPLSVDESHERTQIAFTVVMAGAAMVISAALPFVTYALLALAAINLYRNVKLWTEDANLANPPSVEALDPPSKMILAGFTIGLGIFFLQLNPLSQVIICTFGAGALAAFFVHECLYASQNALNAALRVACQQGELENVKTLLGKQACPYAKDERGNNAISLAKNHDNTAAILKAIEDETNNPPLTLKAVLSTFKEFVNDDVSQKWHQLWLAIKNCILANSRENRAVCYEAISQVFYAFGTPIQHFINNGAKYIKEQFNKPYEKPEIAILVPLAENIPSTVPVAPHSVRAQRSSTRQAQKQTKAQQKEPTLENEKAKKTQRPKRR